jgi:hypothetical protein
VLAARLALLSSGSANMKRLNEVLLFIVEHHLLSMDNSSAVEASKDNRAQIFALKETGDYTKWDNM